MKRNDLVEICKKYNISSCGTKHVLEKRIKKVKFFENHSSSSKIVLHPLKNDLFIHNTLHFVFDKNTKRVIGKFNNISNEIEPLSKNDLNICKQRNLDYQMPIILKGEIQTHRIKTEVENDESDEEL